MPREATPLVVADLSAFARTLGRALKDRHATRAEPPGHVELLNLIARAAGHRNVQALKAAGVAPPGAPSQTPSGAATEVPALAAPSPAPAASASPAPLSEHARRTLLQFDDGGRLLRWPTKFTVQRLALWVLWTRFDAKRAYTEREVNAILKDANTFGDHVTLRRGLVDHGLMTRKSDCSEYRKVAARPDDETRALLQAWRARLHG
jgi:hypothetical protein